MVAHEQEEESIHSTRADWRGVWLKIARKGTGKVVQLVKCSPCKHENLNSSSQKQKKGMVEHTCNPRAREAEVSRPLGLPGQSAQPNSNFLACERLCLKNIMVDMVPGEQYRRLLSSTAMFTHMCLHTDGTHNEHIE